MVKNRVVARAALLGCALAVVASPSLAEEPSYFCVAEVAGGIAPKDGTWVGTSFKTTTKYLVSPASDDPANQYKVTEVGKSIPSHCCRHSGETQLLCGGMGYGMAIDLVKLRYIELYTWGYTENDQTGQNTPSVAGGVCSKL
jgi:hypothetical protein